MGDLGHGNPFLHPGKQASVALHFTDRKAGLCTKDYHCYTLSSKTLLLSQSAYDRKRLLTSFHEFGLDLTTT